jgi:TIR domain
MSHVFISYSHNDRDKLERLVEKLKASGFSEDDIWYDKHIKPGGDWRDEIEIKLKEAFAVAVIVTRKAMCSTYVTYEWSWALGNGTPVVPLLFEDIPYTKIHSRLSKIHHIDCISTIGDDFPVTLKGYKQIPPDVEYLYRLIVDAVMPFRILARVSLWLHLDVNSQLIEQSTPRKLLKQALDECHNLIIRGLPELIVTKTHLLNNREIRLCRDLIKSLEAFRQIFIQADDLIIPSIFPPINPKMLSFIGSGQLSVNLLNQAEIFRQEMIETLISNFLVNSYFEQQQYEKLDHLLTLLSSHVSNIDNWNDAQRKLVLFPLQFATTELIHNKISNKEILEILLGTLEKILVERMS